VTRRNRRGIDDFYWAGAGGLRVVAASLAEKVGNLRIFEDEQGKMNRSLLEVKGAALVVSHSRCMVMRVGKGTEFISAAVPEQAAALYERIQQGGCADLALTVATGIFRAMMSVELVNEGP